MGSSKRLERFVAICAIATLIVTTATLVLMESHKSEDRINRAQDQRQQREDRTPRLRFDRVTGDGKGNTTLTVTNTSPAADFEVLPPKLIVRGEEAQKVKRYLSQHARNDGGIGDAIPDNHVVFYDGDWIDGTYVFTSDTAYTVKHMQQNNFVFRFDKFWKDLGVQGDIVFDDFTEIDDIPIGHWRKFDWPLSTPNRPPPE